MADEFLIETPRCCSKCKTAYPATRKFFGPEPNRKDGLSSQCLRCRCEYIKAWQRSTPEQLEKTRQRARAWKAAYRVRKHGMSNQQYDDLFKNQGGVCFCCKNPETSKHKFLGVDHDHETGKVRHLLCHRCNAALGFMRDDPSRVRELLAYAELIASEKASGTDTIQFAYAIRKLGTR